MENKWDEIILKIRFRDPLVVTDEDVKASFVKIKQRIENNEKVDLPVEKRIRFVASLPFRIAAAVALLFTLGLGGYSYYDSRQVISIANNNGDVKEIVLPDGSEVSLRANSEIQYRKNFQKKRDIDLSGEALFSVTKNTKRPFVVHTSRFDVQVLGTVFDVRVYPSENIGRTILKEGSVKLTNIENEKSVLLKPGEQAELIQENNAIQVRKVKNMDRAHAWKTKSFSFENETLREILVAISDAHNRKLVYELPQENNSRYTLKFTHGEDLAKMLDVMSEIGKFKYKTDAEKIIITEK